MPFLTLYAFHLSSMLTSSIIEISASQLPPNLFNRVRHRIIGPRGQHEHGHLVSEKKIHGRVPRAAVLAQSINVTILYMQFTVKGLRIFFLTFCTSPSSSLSAPGSRFLFDFHLVFDFWKRAHLADRSTSTTNDETWPELRQVKIDEPN